MIQAPSGRRRAHRPAVFASFLFVVGIAHWTLFFVLDREGFRRPSFRSGDWPKEYRYYLVLQQAVHAPQVPYYISRPIPFTRKFLAIPEVLASPQIALLRFLSVDSFIILNTLLLYAVGFFGLLLMRRRYCLSSAAFALLFLLFNFNGHVTAHIAVGHSMWAGYFLLPFFYLSVFDTLDGAPREATRLTLGLVLSVVLMQGALHIFVGCVLFLLLMAAFNPRTFGVVAGALAWAMGVSCWRLAPAVFLVGRTERTFLPGFTGPIDVWQALTVIRDANYERLGVLVAAPWWEYDTYVGVLGVLFLGYFGVYSRFKTVATLQYPGLDGPLLVMVAFSFSHTYWLFSASPVPLLSAERVASRFLALPLGLLTVLSVRRMEAFLIGARSRTLRWGMAGCVLGTAVLLGAHSYTWRLSAVEAALPARGRDLTIAIVPPREFPEGERDRAYVATVRASAPISLAVLIAALWRLRVAQKAHTRSIS